VRPALFVLEFVLLVMASALFGVFSKSLALCVRLYLSLIFLSFLGRFF